VGLQDRYHRDDGRIQRLDRRFTEFGSRLGTLWWEATGISRDRLTRGLVFVSIAAILQHYILYQRATILLFLFVALASLSSRAPVRGGLVEQIQSEASGFPRNAIAFLRLQIMFLGVYLLSIALVAIVTDAFQPDVDSAVIGPNLLMGLALVALQLSDYIRRTNPLGGLRPPGRLVRRSVAARRRNV
jgi:hypothetical protein